MCSRRRRRPRGAAARSRSLVARSAAAAATRAAAPRAHRSTFAIRRRRPRAQPRVPLWPRPSHVPALPGARPPRPRGCGFPEGRLSQSLLPPACGLRRRGGVSSAAFSATRRALALDFGAQGRHRRLERPHGAVPLSLPQPAGPGRRPSAPPPPRLAGGCTLTINSASHARRLARRLGSARAVASARPWSPWRSPPPAAPRHAAARRRPPPASAAAFAAAFSPLRAAASPATFAASRSRRRSAACWRRQPQRPRLPPPGRLRPTSEGGQLLLRRSYLARRPLPSSTCSSFARSSSRRSDATSSPRACAACSARARSSFSCDTSAWSCASRASASNRSTTALGGGPRLLRAELGAPVLGRAPQRVVAVVAQRLAQRLWQLSAWRSVAAAACCRAPDGAPRGRRPPGCGGAGRGAPRAPSRATSTRRPRGELRLKCSGECVVDERRHRREAGATGAFLPVGRRRMCSGRVAAASWWCLCAQGECAVRALAAVGLRVLTDASDHVTPVAYRG